MVLFVLDNEPQPQEERETEAMELENFMDVSSSFCCKTSLFFLGGGGGGGEVQGHSLIRWGRMLTSAVTHSTYLRMLKWRIQWFWVATPSCMENKKQSQRL